MIFDDSAYMHFKTNLRALLHMKLKKYYYSLIGAPKMDTWRGCDDLSLDRRPDP